MTRLNLLLVAMMLNLCVGCDPGTEPPPADDDDDDAGDDDDDTSHCDEPWGEDAQISLPEADGIQDVPLEWFYCVGHLQDDQGSWYGFQHVFFVTDMGGFRSYMGHQAVTLIDREEFFDTEEVGFFGEDWEPAVASIEFETDSQTSSGANGYDSLWGDLEEIQYQLDMTPGDKRPVLHHEDGYHEYDAGGHTYYYSRARMDAEGELVIDGQSIAVSGIAWFDHQYGDLSQQANAGWDWFALQLDDYREVMVFDTSGDQAGALVGATVVEADCSTREVAPADVHIEVLGEWTSPESGCTWPSGWTLTIEGESYTVTPALEDQEQLHMHTLDYWEGACTVSGDATGRAYVELVGYCDV